MKHAPTVIPTVAVTEVRVGSSRRPISKEDFKLKDVASLALFRANSGKRYLLTPRQIEPLHPRTSTIARAVHRDERLPCHPSFSLESAVSQTAIYIDSKKSKKSNSK